MLRLPQIFIAFAVVAVSCSVANRTEPAKVSVSPDLNAQRQNQNISVTDVWMQNCSNCHGRDGQGGGAGTRTLNTKELYAQSNDRKFFDAIKNGVQNQGMESFGKTLSDEAIWAQVVHIREMQLRSLRNEFGGPKAENGTFKSQRAQYRIETVIDTGKGLRVPWGLAWLPDGRMLITNRPGTMFVAKNGQLSPPVENIPIVKENGQGGLMAVAVHPDYARNGWIYIGYSDPIKSGGNACMTKIVRGKLKFSGDKATWTNQQTIFELPQEFYVDSGVHFGNRIVFDQAGHIFFSIGERGSGDLAQDLTRPNGKVYRLNDDGSIPTDNPFASAADKAEKRIGAIWSYGHRNPQGLVFALDGQVYETEHGPRGGDEVNRIQKAANYGWPLICFGINYNDSPYKLPWPSSAQNFTLPIFRWLPSIGACGLSVANGPAFPDWKGDLLAGGLSGQNVDRIRIKNDKLIEREELVFGMGRVRDVACGPDGYVYVALNEPDKIIRLVPAK